MIRFADFEGTERSYQTPSTLTRRAAERGDVPRVVVCRN